MILAIGRDFSGKSFENGKIDIYLISTFFHTESHYSHLKEKLAANLI